MTRTQKEIEIEVNRLLSDKLDGLKDSSNSNKTRYSILALIDDAYEAGLAESTNQSDNK